ncbi:MAG: molybdopterin-guanine dinucleotide biosynthesis protein MobB [Firmicutes bacterium]|nr:molybdopterin-guanine dinucleotide biosynthesis protein MobB [Bacillota bacterium]
MKVINIQGRKKTGKTTTVTKIIEELCRRGYSVGSIKGIHIEGFTMDTGGDTRKHKAAGADPVAARCHDETSIMFSCSLDYKDILKHFDNDWVVIESHVDLNCPNIITGRTAYYDGDGKDVSLEEQINDLTICCSGVIANEIDTFEELPVINAETDIVRLVDLIEEKVEEYQP